MSGRLLSRALRVPLGRALWRLLRCRRWLRRLLAPLRGLLRRARCRLPRKRLNGRLRKLSHRLLRTVFFRGALRWLFRGLLRWRLRGLPRVLALTLTPGPPGRRKRASPLSSDLRLAGLHVARCTVCRAARRAVRRAARRAVRRAVRLPPSSIRSAESLVGECGAIGPIMRSRKRGKDLSLRCWLAA